MKKILIVDDEENILRFLTSILSGDEVEVVSTTEIEEAEYAITHSRPDLLLADIRLTGVLGRTGLELIPYVQEHSPDTRVIIMTGYGTPEIEKEAYELGASYYFEKPIDVNLLLEQIRVLGVPVRAPHA